MARNTIVLKGDLGERYEEARCSGTIKPGHLGMLDSGGKIKPHSVRGGRAERLFPIEEAMIGKTVNDSYYTTGDTVNGVSYPSDDLVRYVLAERGATSLQAWLKKGENVAVGDMLISGGDGTLVKAASAVLANNVASSTAITAAVETTFSNGTVTIPKNTLQIGDRIRVRGQGTIGTATGTETVNIKVKLGTNVVVATGAIDPVTGDIFLFDVVMTVRDLGATGHFIGSGFTYLGTASSAAGAQDIPSASNIAATAFDTTVDQTLTVTCTNSSTGESVTLDTLSVDIVRGTSNALDATGGDLIACVQEALNLSAASADALLAVRII